MSWLLLTKYSVFAYVQLLLSVIITGYLWTVKKPSRPTRLLQQLFSTFTLILAGSLFFVSSFSSNSLLQVIPLTFLVAVGMLQLLRFGYAFPVADFPDESKRCLKILSPILVLIPVIPYLILQKTIGIGIGLLVISALTLLPFGWLTIIFFRKVARYRKAGDVDLASRIKAFTPLLILPLGMALVMILELTNVLALSLAVVLLQVLVMVFLLLFVVIYTNNAPEPTTFLVKIIGPALIFIMIIMGEMGSMQLMTMEDLVTERRLNTVERIRDIIEDAETPAYPPGITSISLLLQNGESRTIFARRPEEFKGFQKQFLMPQIERKLQKAYRQNPNMNLDALKCTLFSGSNGKKPSVFNVITACRVCRSIICGNRFTILAMMRTSTGWYSLIAISLGLCMMQQQGFCFISPVSLFF